MDAYEAWKRDWMNLYRKILLEMKIEENERKIKAMKRANEEMRNTLKTL